MARGIHLKQIRSADLHAIGVPSDRLGETADDEHGRPFGRLAEVDPVLAQTLEAVRQGLEATLSLLDEALAASPPTPAPPPVREERVGCGERGSPQQDCTNPDREPHQ